MSNQSNKPSPAGPEAAPGKKQFLYAFVLTVGACAGWYLGVRPLEQKFKDSEAELEAVTAQLAAFDQLVATEPAIDGVIDALTARGRRTNRAVFASGNPTRLYDAIHELAKAHSVKLARVEPATARTRAAAAPKQQLKGSEVFGHSIEINGTFEAVCKFIDACEQKLGVSKVVTFHISPQAPNTPAGADPVLTAIIETTHLKIAIPNVEPPPPATPTAPQTPTETTTSTEEKGS